jgi:hypothetical protein
MGQLKITTGARERRKKQKFEPLRRQGAKIFRGREAASIPFFLASWCLGGSSFFFFFLPLLRGE